MKPCKVSINILPGLLAFLMVAVIPSTAWGQANGDYFPMESGNWWLLAAIDGPPGVPTDTFFTYSEILGTVTLQDSTYYLASRSFIDSDTLRVDAAGRIWSLGYGQEDLMFDFTAGQDSVYLFPAIRDSDADTIFYNVQVTRNLTISTYAGSFEDCIRFGFDIPVFVDDEISYSFAPGIGLVEISGAWVYGKLFSAQIGDRTIASIVATEETPAVRDHPKFSVYPNPVRDKGWIEINFEKSETVDISIFDLLGRQVNTILSATLPAGKHKIPFAVEALAPSIYFIRLNTPRSTSTQKLSLAPP